MNHDIEASNPMQLSGAIRYQLIDSDGSIKQEGEVHNLITRIGDQVYAERGCGMASPAAAPTGMKLGTGSTAAAKTGAGAALVTYLTNSHQAFDSGYPQSALSGEARRITYLVTFAPGKATTGSNITECVIVNHTLTDATSTAANTVSRALFSPAITGKGSGDTLIVTWQHDLQGA